MIDIYSISYDEAKKFLEGLSDNDISTLLDSYDSSNIEDLADIISDIDLYNAGFKNEVISEKDTVNGYGYEYTEIDDIVNFLNSLDEDTLDELKYKYYAIRVEDLAVAISDTDLKKLGFVKEDETEKITDTTPTIFESGDFDDYNVNIDFMEDAPNDINYVVIDPENYVFAVKDEIDFNKLKENLDPNLVEYCEILDYSGDSLEDSGVYFQVVPTESYNKDTTIEVSEDVVINKELNPMIFNNEDHTMKEEVLLQLKDYYNSLLNYLAEKGIDLEIDDVVLVGSNAGYLYLPKSDIDLHLMSKPLDVDVFEMLKDVFDIFEAENPLVIGDSNVEFGIEDGYNTVMSVEKPRRYSIISNEWIDGSDNYELFTEADITAVEGYEDIVNNYVAMIDDVIANDEYADAVILKKEIRQNRSNDLANIGALSMGNVVFKELRNNGAYGKLKDYIKSKELNM